MALHQFSRTALLVGEEALLRLEKATVAVFGIGGVGSFAVEALVRAGIGRFVLVDDDLICITNINRQLHATMKTVARPKVEAMKERMLLINPRVIVETRQAFYLPENAAELFDDSWDYVVDTIDTVAAKLDLAQRATERGIPIISAMGAGNKMDPTRFEVADINQTSVCPLARVMRKELRKRGVPALKVVYSREEPLPQQSIESASCRMNCVCPGDTPRSCTDRRHIPGSISFVPSVMGLIIAGEVVKDLIDWHDRPAPARTKEEED